MRFLSVAACAAVLSACTQRSDSPNEVAPANEVQAANEVGPPEPAELVTSGAGDPVANETGGGKISACLIQDGERLNITAVKAIGTEPFWGARIEGRCVTYSTPEDQAGTRIWARFNPGPDGGVWVGTFQGKPFKLITRLKPDCSDGMSDRVYPQGVTLTVGGEERRGCAAPE